MCSTASPPLCERRRKAATGQPHVHHIHDRIPAHSAIGANGSSTFVIETIQRAFTFRQVGLASAMAVVLLIIVLVVTFIQRRLVPDEEVTLS